VTAVPELSTTLLLAGCLALMVAVVRRRRGEWALCVAQDPDARINGGRLERLAGGAVAVANRPQQLGRG
jgi:hypothetical protein